MKDTRNIYTLKRGGGAVYAVQFKAAGARYWRVFSASAYGSATAALAAATAKRNRIRQALDKGADAAWLFYVYGGAERPAIAPTNFIWQ